MRTVTLREILEPRNDIVHPRDNPSGDGVFVGLEHIEPNTGRRIGSVPIRLEELTGRKARFCKGDIVYGYLRPYLNKVWVADFDGYCSVDQYVFRTKGTADPAFVAAFMRSPMFLASAPIAETPGQLPRIRLDEVLDVPIRLPELTAQRRVGARLGDWENRLSPLATMVAERDHFASGLRAQAMAACLRDESGRLWPTQAFDEILETPMRTGVSGQESPSSPMRGLSIAAVRGGRLDLSTTRGVDVPADTDRLVREGAVYIVRGNGRLDLVGRAGVAPRPETPVVFPDLLIEARADPEVMEADYLVAAWEAGPTRHAIEATARTSSGIYKVNLAGISSVRVPTPPIVEQRRIAAELRERLATIDQMTRAIDTQLEAIDALPAALLRRAFSEIEAA